MTATLSSSYWREQAAWLRLQRPAPRRRCCSAPLLRALPAAVRVRRLLLRRHARRDAQMRETAPTPSRRLDVGADDDATAPNGCGIGDSPRFVT